MVAEKREYCTILEIDHGKLSLKARKKKKINSVMCNALLLSMTDYMSFGLVDEVNSIGNPG